MKSGSQSPWLLVAACLSVSVNASAADDAPGIDFNREIRPILSEACYQCHGPDHNKRKADLRLDNRDGLFRVVDGTAVVVPGKPETSELFHRITTDDALDAHASRQVGSASDAGADQAHRGLDRQGAPWKGHWSYVRLSRPKTPGAAERAHQPTRSTIH